MSSMSAFLSGVALGLSVTMPVGPMSVLCIERALRYGALAGFTTGLGAATVLVGYTTCVLLGLAPAITLAFGNGHALLSAISACLLLCLSLRVLSRSVSLTGTCTEERGALSSYFSAVAFALFNPLTPVLLAAALPAIAAPESSGASSTIAGVFTASVTWWLIVSGSVAIMRSRLNLNILNLINKASGLVLGALGTAMAANAFAVRF